jgi:outer membrane protein assembly factor BamB
MLKHNLLGYQIARRIALVAAVFSLVVCALLLYDYSRRQMKDPFEAQTYLALKAALKQQPENEQLQGQIAALDQSLREEYSRQRQFSAAGGLLLCGGVIVFLIAANTAVTLNRKLPEPGPLGAAQDADSQWVPLARWGVGTLTVFLVAGAIGLSLSARSPLAEDLDEAEEIVFDEPAAPTALAKSEAASEKKAEPVAAVEATPQPTDHGTGAYTASEQELRSSWPGSRAQHGSGISPYTNVPDTWDAASGKNVLWKTAVPLPGNNSPIVCGRRVFLSGADDKGERRQVYGFDTADGKLLWQGDVAVTPQGKPSADQDFKVQGDTGFASPTCATDGKRVFAIFANGDVAAFDLDGKPVWTRGLGIPENSYGHAASLLVYKNLLLVPMDQGTGKSGKSRLFALDVATGKTVWEQSRPVPNSWTTPIVIHHAGRDQIITAANPWVIAHDPKDGKEIWRVKGLSSGDVAPSPVFAGGTVYVANDPGVMLAIRPDGQGDVTKTHVLWKGEDNLPDTCSPVATEQHVFLVTASGMLACYDAKKGEMLWDKDFEKPRFHASPSLVGKRLYLISDEGKGLIIEPDSKECKIVSEANLGEKCSATPAFQDGRIYIRGEKHLYCIGKK